MTIDMLVTVMGIGNTQVNSIKMTKTKKIPSFSRNSIGPMWLFINTPNGHKQRKDNTPNTTVDFRKCTNIISLGFSSIECCY